MSKPACTEDEFIEMFETHGATETARRLNITERNVYERRSRLQLARKRLIYAPTSRVLRFTPTDYPQRIQTSLQDGVVIVGSDAHYWPGSASTAHKAMLEAIKEYNPVAVIQNGDAFDGASISRHPPIGWENNPTVEDEIDACRERLNEIEQAVKPGTELIWTLGNHDARFETRLATAAPQYAKVHGVHLKDHFPNWRNSWSFRINDDVVIKHRLKGGVHATHNNTVSSGRTMVTGHLHSLKVTPWSDYNGTRWGVDTGTLADPYGPQFNDYTEDSPVNWRSGFAILTFDQGELLWPEVVHVRGPGVVEFRGKRYAV